MRWSSACTAATVLVALVFSWSGAETPSTFAATTAQGPSVGSHEMFRPREPLAGEDWRAAEVFAFGESPEDTGIRAVTALAILPTGETLVLDGPSAEILVLDHQGSHIRTIGRRGQGPGELVTPSGISVDPAGTILVYDAGTHRATMLGRSGEYLASWQVALPRLAIPEGIVAGRNREVFLLVPASRLPIRGRTGPNAPKIVSHSQGAESVAEVRTFLRLAKDPPASVDELRTARLELFGPRVVWAGAPDGRLIVGISDEYRLTFISTDGRTLGEIGRDIGPTPVPEEYKQRLLGEMPESFATQVDLDGNLPIMTAVLPGPDRTFLVVRGDDVTGQEVTVDVLQESGPYLGSFGLPAGFVPMAARDGLIVGVQVTAEETVVRGFRVSH